MGTFTAIFLASHMAGCLVGNIQVGNTNGAAQRCNHIDNVRTTELGLTDQTYSKARVYDEFEMGCRRGIIEQTRSLEQIINICTKERRSIEEGK